MYDQIRRSENTYNFCHISILIMHKIAIVKKVWTRTRRWGILHVEYIGANYAHILEIIVKIFELCSRTREPKADNTRKERTHEKKTDLLDAEPDDGHYAAAHVGPGG